MINETLGEKEIAFGIFLLLLIFSIFSFLGVLLGRIIRTIPWFKRRIQEHEAWPVIERNPVFFGWFVPVFRHGMMLGMSRLPFFEAIFMCMKSLIFFCAAWLSFLISLGLLLKTLEILFK